MRLPPAGKLPRVIGFDDAPFPHRRYAPVRVSGVVCAGTRFEGLLWGTVSQSGWNATDVIETMLRESKFLAQVHAVLFDGIAVGGFNVIDLPALSKAVDRPCIAVMRKPPDMDAVTRAVRNLPRADERLARIARAGVIHSHPPFHFQCQGVTPEDALSVLQRATDNGHVPEALRIAHMIGSAVMKGQSGRRA